MYMAGFNAGGPTSAEFGNKEACESAIAQVEKESMRAAFTICVPKYVKGK